MTIEQVRERRVDTNARAAGSLHPPLEGEGRREAPGWGCRPLARRGHNPTPFAVPATDPPRKGEG